MQYHRPGSLDAAVTLLRDLGDRGMPLAGGTFFVPHRRELFTDIEAVVDVQDLGLGYITLENETLRIGAAASLASLLESPVLKNTSFRIIPETVAQITPLELRNRATVGGDLCISAETDLPTALIALNAELLVVSGSGTRTIPLEQFYAGYLENTLQVGELVTEVTVPLPGRMSGSAFYKFKRRAIDLPVLNAAALVELDAGGSCVAVRIVLGCAEAIPVRAGSAEKALLGTRCEDADIVRSSEATGDIDYLGDIRASSELRRVWGRVAVREVLREAVKRARES